MTRYFQFFISVAVIFMNTACTTPISKYADNTPTLTPESFFNGKLTAHGVVKDFKGKVIRSFNADITAYWVDGIGTLDEDFVFDDGEQQKRVWTLTPQRSEDPFVRLYEGAAGDVVKPALVRVSGNAMLLKYILRVKRDKGEIDITVDDKMYLINDKVIINQSKLKKWGLPVGEVLLTIVKH